MTKLEAQLIRHEDNRLKPYEDSVGKMTIGVGRNLDDNGISEEESMFLFKNDIASATREASTLIYFDELNEARQSVIINMVFNMGLPTFMEFVKTNAALRVGNYDLAADEMVDSKWYRQVKSRGVELVAQMRTGEWAG